MFLAHILNPSENPDQIYDIFIYLIKHKHPLSTIEEVKYVEFYFGRQWGNKIFKVNNDGGFIGVNLSAYGEFLCTCKVTLKDGSSILLDKYIDFESKKNN